MLFVRFAILKTQHFRRYKMNQSEVENLMKSSKSETEWNANCDKVKAACNGYSDFWYTAIIMSGLYTKVKVNW